MTQPDIAADLDQLRKLSMLQSDSGRVPLAADIVHQIPVYDGSLVRRIAADADTDSVNNAQALQLEWADVMLNGAGVIAIRNAVDDLSMLDEVTSTLQKIMRHEAQGQTAADHFASGGSNSRIWNAHEKLCMQEPELFARYYANDTMAMACRAWLGPGYQITAQANIVHPGGKAQVCHRDYHMGFQQNDLLREYPAHVHTLSPLLTLQGGIAHCDVPLDAGPTQLLPFSQKLANGYMSVESDPIREHFDQHFVQLALGKGDMLFFNPALFHAAGDNRTSNIHRFVNLFQVGSAYGRTLEIVDRAKMSITLYPVLQALHATGSMSPHYIRLVIEACAEGYAFPASLDLEPPVDGLAPPSQQLMMRNALAEGLSPEDFAKRIRKQQSLKRSS